MNVFQADYPSRLKSWYNLRNQLQVENLPTICIEIDNWWQRAPLVNHYLHPVDILTWPGPWELLAENNYCTIARGLGMCYTLLLLGIDQIEFILGTDDLNEDVALVLVDNAKCVMNYYPNSVLNTSLQNFNLVNSLNIGKLKDKIGTK